MSFLLVTLHKLLIMLTRSFTKMQDMLLDTTVQLTRVIL